MLIIQHGFSDASARIDKVDIGNQILLFIFIIAIFPADVGLTEKNPLFVRNFLENNFMKRLFERLRLLTSLMKFALTRF